MIKKFTTLAIAAVFAISLSAPQAVADKRNRQKNAAIGAAIALGLIGAMAAHEQDKRGNKRYRPRRNIRPSENAVGACMLRAKRLVRRAGGYRTKLNTVRRLNHKPNGRTVVVFDATGFYDFGRKRSRIRCVVKNNRVIKFKFN